MKTVALDIGDSKIGVAISDITGTIACAYETYKRSHDTIKDAEHIEEFCKKNNVDTIVAGMPLKIDGTNGRQAEKTIEFVKTLQKLTTRKIEYQDERYTTNQAERLLIDSGLRRSKRKTVIDKVAATIILQCYLDKINNKKIVKNAPSEDSSPEVIDLLTFENENGSEDTFEVMFEVSYDDKTYLTLYPYSESQKYKKDLKQLKFCEKKVLDNGVEDYIMINDSTIIEELKQKVK
jgi:putative Holliday junction resolvase